MRNDYFNVNSNLDLYYRVGIKTVDNKKIKDFNVSVKKFFIYNNHQSYNHSIINSIIKNAEKLKIKQFITKHLIIKHLYYTIIVNYKKN